MRPTALARALTRYTLAAPSPLTRVRGSPTVTPSLHSDFAIYPDFYNSSEARALLDLALWKLDRVDSTRRRGRRGEKVPAAPSAAQEAPLQDMFSGSYGFEEGHFDAVIHQYRESLITALPPTADDALAKVLARLYRLVPSLEVSDAPSATALPPPGSSTHALHLSPAGEILPHVDNIEASGETIVGASLGATRILRLEHKDDAEKHGWDILLPSGSVYVQRGSVRYDYKHSILPYSAEHSWEGVQIVPGHRVSFMVRDAPSKPAQL